MPSEIRRVIAADAEPRSRARVYTKAQRFLRFDPTHELPIVIETEAGRIIARFACDGDAALFVAEDRHTLPTDFVRAAHAGQS